MATQNPNILFQVIDDSTFNVEGELDVYNPEKFPLALTFSIKDVMDMTSTKGSFSKSFKIPATSNNNEVLKFLISDSFYNSFEYIEGKKARIFVDGQLILEGAFQVKGHGVLRTPEYYECLVFGDNYKWVNAIDKLNLCDIDFTAGGFYPDSPSQLTFGRDAIMATWDYNLSGQIIGGVGTHVVYPLVNTGKWTHGDFAHMDDMSPAIFILDCIKVILAAQGYTLESNFMQTDWFKKLISVTPQQSWENSNEIMKLYQFEYEQSSGGNDWKTPWDFRTSTGHSSSDFYGQFRGMTMATPTSDPSSLITKQTWFDNFIDVGSTLSNPINGDMYHYMGWYWGSACYDSYPLNGSFNLTGLVANNSGTDFGTLCGTGNYAKMWGTNWDCVWLDAAPLPSCVDAPSGGYSRPFVSSDRFQTDYFGTYEFNGSARVMMDNDAVLNNYPADYDPFFDCGAMHDYDGFGYGSCSGVQSQSLSLYYRWSYECVLYVMHYEKSLNKVNVIPVDIDIKKNFCDGGSGIALPMSNMGGVEQGNLVFNVSFSGLQIQILDGDDYVYYYTEVNEVGHYEEITPQGGLTGKMAVCQCKYKMQKGTMNGGISKSLVDGSSINVGTLLPCDVTQLEWLNGLTGLFNLYWQADEMTKTIYVEPRDNFFEGADTAVDWSDKLDWGEKQTAKYVYDSLKRNLCFTYQNDSADGFVEERNRRKGQICELASHVMDLGELFVNEDEQIGSNYYAPTYMMYDRVIGTSNSAGKVPFIPVIHSEYTEIWNTTNNADYPDKIDEHVARILLWGGKTPLNHQAGFSNSYKFRWGKEDPTLPPDELNYYPFAGVYCDQDHTYFGALSVGSVSYFPQLYFEDTEANMAQPPPVPYEVCNGLYDVFWERNIENLLTRPKIKTAMFHLTPQDISQLKFQKLIYIENSESSTYFIINKIVDFKPAMNQMTKVELFEWTLAKPRKKSSPRLGQQYGVSKDSGIGQEGSNINRIETNFSEQLGITGPRTIQSATTPNLCLTSPTTPMSEMGIENRTIDPSAQRWQYQNVNGTTLNKGSSDKSFNLGNNNNVKQNSGNITIGQNNKNVTQSGIIIGQNCNSWSVDNNPIEFHTGARSPALVITSSGEVLEGGGGTIVYEDASGNFHEVWTQVNLLGGETEYKKILKSRK